MSVQFVAIQTHPKDQGHDEARVNTYAKALLWLQMQAPAGKYRGPIYSAMSAPRGAQFVPQRPQMGQLPMMQMGYDAAQLMAQEFRSMTLRRRLAKIADLEAQLAADPLPGFHQVCFLGHEPRVGAAL